MTEYEIHPVAALFPMLPDDELDELAADIAENVHRRSPGVPPR